MRLKQAVSSAARFRLSTRAFCLAEGRTMGNLVMAHPIGNGLKSYLYFSLIFQAAIFLAVPEWLAAEFIGVLADHGCGYIGHVFSGPVKHAFSPESYRLYLIVAVALMGVPSVVIYAILTWRVMGTNRMINVLRGVNGIGCLYVTKKFFIEYKFLAPIYLMFLVSVLLAGITVGSSGQVIVYLPNNIKFFFFSMVSVELFLIGFCLSLLCVWVRNLKLIYE